MAISDDFSVAVNGDIRYTGAGTNYTVIAFHRWLGDLMDDAQAAGNDILDITDATASERSTDNIITLNSPYNIDDIASQHLYDGSIIQDSGNTIYDGILVFAAAGTYLQVLQSGLPVYPNFWTTSLNPDAGAGISHRFMLKVRTGGTDIDGRRLIGQTREFGFTYSEFKTTTARGNNVLALTYASDLNNQTAAATVKGWTAISNTEGYRLLDVNNDTTDEPYYSEWNKATFTINQLFERSKWLSRRSTIEDSNAETGTNYVVDNGTITGQAQGFNNGVVAQYLTRVHLRLKKVGSPTGNLVVKIYSVTGAFQTATPNASLGTSVNFDTSKLTTSYLEYEIAFTTQYFMSASTPYFIVIEHADGTATDYVHVEGDATGTHGGNKAENNAGWTAQAGEEKKAEEAKAEEKKAAEKKEEEERGREIKSPRLQILLTAVPKEVITKYNRITKLAGLNLRGLEVETAASVRSILGNDKSTVLLMDFGARSTNINVIYNGYPVMSHSIDTAGFDLTKVLSQGMGVSLRRAEDLKKERGLKAGLAEAEMISIMTPLVDKIFTETERIVNIYVRRTGKRLDRVVILGGGALLPGVEEYVSLRLGLPAVTGNSFARVIYPPILEPMIKEIGPMFSVAMGLGMREIV